MHIVIAPDGFKECCTAVAVADALAEGWRRVFPDADLRLVPMADGGEGTVEALVTSTGGKRVTIRACGPLGDPVDAAYGILGDGETAVIEMAATSGLSLVPLEKRNPAAATTRGTGELIRHALDSGVRRIIVGIGGSATNDGGAGMAQALGCRLLDAEGVDLPPGGEHLIRLERIDITERHPKLQDCEVLVACDVDNPLCGPNGASYVYGPQKGADGVLIAKLDAALRRYGEVIEAQLGIPVLSVPGSGAAGGLGAGLLAFAGGRLRPGVEVVAEACGLARHLEGADLVITAEGRLDRQSIHGKTPVGVARFAKVHGVPVLVVAGALGPGYHAVYACGVDAVCSICPGPMSLAEAIRETSGHLRDTAETLGRLWRLFRGAHTPMRNVR